jgi:predicted RNA-binding protein YlqC (UPF0109 family)
MKESRQYGRTVAGLCLLGEKDNYIDHFEPIITSNGCWDAPEVSYKQFDTVFQRMIKKDRAVVGMALIRPKGYGELITNELKQNIHNMRNTFSDITKTIWLVVSDKGIHSYRPYKDASGRIVIKPYHAKKLYDNPEESKLIAATEITKKSFSAKVGTNDKIKLMEKARKIIQSIRPVVKQKKPKARKKLESSLPHGCCLLKMPNGEEILWRTS